MLSSEFLFATKWRRSLVALCAVLALSLLQACSFQPLYGTSSTSAGVAEKLKTVEIATIRGRTGHRLRSELIFKTTRGGSNTDLQYRLDVALRQSLTSVLVEKSGESQGQILSLEATFSLVDRKTDKVVFSGKSRSRAAFDKFEAGFTNIRAQIDAEQRASRVLADGITTRLAAYFSRNG